MSEIERVELTPAQLRRDLRRLVDSEEGGIALFTAAERVSQSEKSREAWHAMGELEIHTNDAVSRFLAMADIPVSPVSTPARIAGTVGGVVLPVVPSAVLGAVFRQGTKLFLPAFRRLAGHYRGTDYGEFFDYVVAHELALVDYATGAQRKDPNALDSVNRLLDAGVPL